MAEKSAQELYAERVKRIRDAVALKTPDRIPVLANGHAWPGRVLGLKMSDIAANVPVSTKAFIDVWSRFEGLDAIQIPGFHHSVLSMMWLAKVKVPGRDLPDDELWQIDESELMKVEDYDAILAEGFGPWLARYYKERLPGVAEEFGAFAAELPKILDACREIGMVVLSPASPTIPYEYFCGGRTMKEFMLDLYRHGDKVQAAMDEALPVLIENMRQLIRGLGLMGVWIGGWRTASEFLAPRLWERFAFPYLQKMVDACIEEGAIPVLHFDADWTRDLGRLKDLPKGKAVLALDGKTDIFKAKEALDGHMCIMGDVPASLLSLGTPDEVTAYCERLIREIGPAGFMLASGCDVPPTAKYENVKAMIDAVQ